MFIETLIGQVDMGTGAVAGGMFAIMMALIELLKKMAGKRNGSTYSALLISPQSEQLAAIQKIADQYLIDRALDQQFRESQARTAEKMSEAIDLLTKIVESPESTTRRRSRERDHR